ncbi:MAG: hypothetical protein I8H75_02010 [Myxococcaceae bacterium]|nr:hypothetical protein [Myxococcaceae bacterium]MBH2006110.1 hypothetical protein [Myxococcaceae bacterium]
MRWIAVISTAFLFACATPVRIRPLELSNTSWKPVNIKGAQQAWIVPGEGSSLLVDVHCNPRDLNVPLIGLTGQLLIGMTDQILISQTKIPYQEREALLSTYEVKVDGIPQKIRTLVLKKNQCIYDLVLSAPISDFDRRVCDFDHIQQHLKLELNP